MMILQSPYTLFTGYGHMTFQNKRNYGIKIKTAQMNTPGWIPDFKSDTFLTNLTFSYLIKMRKGPYLKKRKKMQEIVYSWLIASQFYFWYESQF